MGDHVKEDVEPRRFTVTVADARDAPLELGLEFELQVLPDHDQQVFVARRERVGQWAHGSRSTVVDKPQRPLQPGAVPAFTTAYLEPPCGHEPSPVSRYARLACPREG